MRFKIESRHIPVEALAVRIRDYRGTDKTIDSFLNACVDAAHELDIPSYYFRVDNNLDLGWQIVAVYL